MPTTLLINGAHGRMGRETVKAITACKDLQLVGQTGRQDDLAAAIKTTQAQVVIDFTNAETVFINCKTIIAANAHPVIGTSGLLPAQVEELQELCAQKRLGGIIAPNFSIGAILLMRFAKEAAEFYTHAEIIERHHLNKLDAPSGTAVKTAHLIANARSKSPLERPEKELLPGGRGADLAGVRIHALRLPGVLAEQDVVFGGPGETLTISHRTLDRETYMPGILLACRKVLELDTLVYGLENILK